MAKVNRKGSLPPDDKGGSKKIDLVAITSEMSEEEILQNLLKVLKKQGIEVKENTNEKK